MKLISLVQQQEPRKHGRLSDGSDATIVVESWWQATVLDDDGKEQVIDFPVGGAQPTNQQILDAIPRPATIVPSSKADLLIYMRTLRDDWMGWREVRLEAQARPSATTAIQPLIVQENTAWNLLLQAITWWMQAP